MGNDLAFLRLLQLASPALPVGSYSYSEGLETLVDKGAIANLASLKHWIERSLHVGAIRLDAAVMVRVHRCVIAGDLKAIARWNAWLSAAWETEELRASSWQMGSALSRLLVAIQPEVEARVIACGSPCNFAIAFGIAAAHWQIGDRSTVLAYLHTWATNLITAGVKLIPLGQTAGQQLLLDLNPNLITAAGEILSLEDDDLCSCSWGLALASMFHEIQYSRLFRS